MDEHREELATLESIDSGAVYTLALKTHIGMSIDTFRYMAGWCDKIQGSTIPINQARPNRNLTYTKREPIGYAQMPLFMISQDFLIFTNLNPIFHCNTKSFALGTFASPNAKDITFASPNAKNTNMLVSLALGDANFSPYLTQNPQR